MRFPTPTPIPSLRGQAQMRLALLGFALFSIAIISPGDVLAASPSSAFNDAIGHTLTTPRKEPVLPDEPDWLADEWLLDSEFDESGDPDPWEGFNRATFSFNRGVDRFVLNPITHIYQALLPGFVRKGLHNVFVNLDAPVRITNALLQGRPKAAGKATGRFLVNTTFGVGGLFEAGERVGLSKQNADFGQTLASWGVPRGPYVVIPVLGPMTVRNGLGMGIDIAFQPLSYVAGPLPGAMVGIGRDFSKREQHFAELQALEGASLDFYAAFRSAFLQDRAGLDSEGQPESGLLSLTSAGSDLGGIAALSGMRDAAINRCLGSPRALRSLFKVNERRRVRERCRNTVLER